MEVVNCFEVTPLEGEEDYISSMPENVISNIMDRLPVKDAVGTSILSTSWRFKWTLLTKLILNVDFFDGLDNHFDKNNITKLLLHLKGPVTNFNLFVSNRFKIDDEDIHHWVMLLSRLRGLMELTLMNWWRHTVVKLRTHLFSCLELRHLTLDRCVFPHCFRGFPKLLSLHLQNVYIQDHRCGELIAQCPLLENLQISNSNTNLGGELKLVEIAKLENLKELRLSLCLLDNLTMLRLSTVLQQMSLLPKLQELSLDFNYCKFLPEDVTQNPVSSNFPFLKTLSLWQMDFSSVSMLSCAFGMLFGCANLQTLRIRATYKNVVPLPAINLPEVDCSTMRLQQLQNVTLLGSIKGLENEVCLIKHILACSPMLKIICIPLNSSIERNGNEKSKLESKLLKLHRASPMAKVIVKFDREKCK